MLLKILGTGCPNCKLFEKNALQAISELGKKIKVEKVTDITEIMSYDVMGLPAMVLNDKLQSAGRVLSVEEIKEILEGDNGCGDCQDCHCHH